MGATRVTKDYRKFRKSMIVDVLGLKPESKKSRPYDLRFLKSRIKNKKKSILRQYGINSNEYKCLSDTALGTVINMQKSSKKESEIKKYLFNEINVLYRIKFQSDKKI